MEHLITSKCYWKQIRTCIFCISWIFCFSVFDNKFQVLFGMCGGWLICFLLTIFDVLPSKSDKYGFSARTDINLDAVTNSPWFHVPYPGKWIGIILQTVLLFYYIYIFLFTFLIFLNTFPQKSLILVVVIPLLGKLLCFINI